ncbi:MAG: histidinol-phosphate transaminase [Clostridia bacterium]|nr:histidinol-phosphate transaminase [Clostridia bacterium]
MSRFFSSKFSSLDPYVPGEQPIDKKYVKLNTNESPFPPSPIAVRYAENEARLLNLYSDPTANKLTSVAAEKFNVNTNEIIFSNGSDEILNFAFSAFCDSDHPAVFPNITYGFYPVFARYNNIPYEEIPLKEDFSINTDDYCNINKTIFIANPNAPTGISVSLKEIEKIVSSNPHNVVVIDEAYVDFGGESSVQLIKDYENLLVVQTFSKSRSLAGGRLGFGIASELIINDLNTVKYSTNPYNVNRMTMAAGIGALEDEDYTQNNIKIIISNRNSTIKSLNNLGFQCTDSKTNFIFAKHKTIGGKELYLKLKENGVLVRHFDTPLLTDYVRITVGSENQMNILIEKLKNILEG